MGPRARGGNWGSWGSWGDFGREACGPGFKWRFFDRGDLKYVILRLLREKPMHGYEVMRSLEENSGGWYRASAGSVYPTLQMLEDQGFVVSEERDGKKVYRVTEAGERHLDANKHVVEDIFERVSDFTSGIFRSEMAGLTRTFGRLGQAAFERAAKWPGDEDVLAQIKQILDRAVHDLEAVRPRARSDNA